MTGLCSVAVVLSLFCCVMSQAQTITFWLQAAVLFRLEQIHINTLTGNFLVISSKKRQNTKRNHSAHRRQASLTAFLMKLQPSISSKVTIRGELIELLYNEPISSQTYYILNLEVFLTIRSAENNTFTNKSNF